MKAVTIWQPWASLIACGAKKYETRGWPTKYRGPIAIHAALKKPPAPWPELGRVLDQYAEKMGRLDELPRGAIIATAELVDVWKLEKTIVDGEIRARRLNDNNQPTIIGFYPTDEEMALVKRGITVNIKFAPNKNRQVVNTTINVTTKLAATEAIDTQMIMGVNVRTGKMEIAEYNGQIRGQVMLTDVAQPADEPEALPEPEAVQQPSGKPLDLRNRNKKPEAMEPGVDFDPDTGEVFDSPTDATNSKVIPIDKQAAQA